MRIFCPYCSSEHSVDANQIPLVGMDLACPHCHHSFHVTASGEIEAREDAATGIPSEPLSGYSDPFDAGFDFAPPDILTEEERQAASLDQPPSARPRPGRFPLEEEVTEVVTTPSDFVAGKPRESIPFVQPTAAPDPRRAAADPQQGSYHRTSPNLSQPADVVWQDGQEPQDTRGVESATWTPEPTPRRSHKPRASAPWNEDLGGAETLLGVEEPSLRADTIRQDSSLKTPSSPSQSSARGRRAIQDDVYGERGPRDDTPPAPRDPLNAPFDLEAPSEPERATRAPGHEPGPATVHDDWSFPDLDFDADPFGSPPVEPAPTGAGGDIPPIPPDDDVFDLGLLDEVFPDPAPAAKPDRAAAAEPSPAKEPSGLFDLDYEIGRSEPPHGATEGSFEAMSTRTSARPSGSASQRKETMGSGDGEEMDFSALLREEVGEDDYLREDEPEVAVPRAASFDHIGEKLSLDELPDGLEGAHDRDATFELRDDPAPLGSARDRVASDEFAPARVPRPSQRRRSRSGGGGGRVWRVALLVVLMLVALGVAGGQIPEVGYFGLNLLLPATPQQVEVAVPPTPQPVAVDEAALRDDRIANYVSQIEDFEKSLQKDPATPGAKRALVDVLQRFGARFPEEFAHNKRYQRRLDELSGELRDVEDGAFAARRALLAGDPAAARQALESHIRQQAGGPELQLLYGQIEMRDGRFDKALLHLQAALEADPESIEARYLQGDCHQRLGQLREAREAFEAVLQKSPKHDSARVGLAEIRLAMGEGALALELATDILADAVERKLTEQSFLAHSLLARIHAQTGDAEAERRHLEEAASIKPLDEGVVLALARYLSNRQRFEESKRRLESCWDKGCGSPAYYRELSAVYLELAEFDHAVECAGRGLEEHPQESGLMLLQGRALYRRGDMVAAKDAYQRLIDLAPGQTEAYLELTALLLETNQAEGARDLLEQAIPQVSEPAPLFARLAEVHARLGDHGKARQSLATLVEKDPMNFSARLQLAEQLKALGLIAEALPHYEFLYRNDQLQRNVRLSYADALREARRYEEAERELQQLVALDPTDKVARALIGAVLVEVNRHEEAEAFLRSVVEEDALDSMGHYYMGRLMLSRGKKREALDLFGRALAGRGPRPEYRFDYGQTLLALGGKKNLEDAVGAFSGIISRYESGKSAGGIFERMVDVYLARGEAEMALLHFDKALEDFEKAMRLDPLRADAVTSVASGLIKKRRFPEAERYLQMVVAENPRFAAAHHQLGLLYDRRGEKVKARTHFHKAIAEDESAFPLAYRHLGFLYREKRLDKEARRYFLRYLELAGEDARDAEDVRRLLGAD